jgi:hypothetical protein
MKSEYLKQLISENSEFGIILHMTNGDKIEFYPEFDKWGVNLEDNMFFVYCRKESDDCYVIPVSNIIYVTIK